MTSRVLPCGTRYELLSVDSANQRRHVAYCETDLQAVHELHELLELLDAVAGDACGVEAWDLDEQRLVMRINLERA